MFFLFFLWARLISYLLGSVFMPSNFVKTLLLGSKHAQNSLNFANRAWKTDSTGPMRCPNLFLMVVVAIYWRKEIHFFPNFFPESVNQPYLIFNLKRRNLWFRRANQSTTVSPHVNTIYYIYYKKISQRQKYIFKITYSTVFKTTYCITKVSQKGAKTDTQSNDLAQN